ncbi:MAG: tetratricopeptide repeat protein [Candidatus Peribacteraceae bacterium]|nr:tetratricopeptide repeat protein [Candidatus Peribacteraceae bacterium]
MQRIVRFIDEQPASKIALVLFAVAALFYLPTVGFGFVAMDDNLLVVNNQLIRSLDLHTLKRIFTSFDPELYVPLTTLSFNLNFVMGGLEPWIYHLTNIALFAVNVALVFSVTEKLSGKRWISIITALLFLVHPINTEAAAWVSARKDLLSTCFYLLSILFWLKDDEGEDKLGYIYSITVFTLALLSKVTAVTLPVVLILLELRKTYGRTRKELAIRLSPFFVLSIIFGLIAILGKSKNLVELSIIETLLLGAKSTAFMFWKIFLPANLSVLYPQNGTVNIAAFILPLISIGILLAVLLLTMKKWRTISLCILFTVITFAPNFFTFMKNGEIYVFSDRYAYLPSIGLFLAAAIVIHQLILKWPKLITASVSIVLVILGTLSQIQAQTWRDSMTLLTYTLTLNPRSAIAHNNLGTVLMDQGNDEGALKEFDLAIENNPRLMNAWINRGNVLTRRGDVTGAKESDQAAIRSIGETNTLRPDDLLGYYALGERLEKEGKIEEALTTFIDAAKRAPHIAEAQYNAAVMLHKHGKPEQAVELYTKAVALDPTMLDARYALAALLAERGLLPEAASHLRAIVAIDPGYAQAAVHLQRINAILGN